MQNNNLWDFSNDKAPSYGILPKGFHKVNVVSVELKETKMKTGKYLSVEFKCCEGEFQGKPVYHNFNVQNQSTQAQEIGRGEFKSLLNCVGLPDAIEDPRVIVNKIVTAKVGSDSYNGVERATIKGFFPASKMDEINGSKSSAPSAAPIGF